MTTVLNRTGEVLSKDGLMPVAVAVSLLSSCDNYWEVFSNPLSSVFWALLGGTIIGGFFSDMAPKSTKPWIVGGLLLVASGTVLGRAFGKWNHSKKGNTV